MNKTIIGFDVSTKNIGVCINQNPDLTTFVIELENFKFSSDEYWQEIYKQFRARFSELKQQSDIHVILELPNFGGIGKVSAKVVQRWSIVVGFIIGALSVFLENNIQESKIVSANQWFSEFAKKFNIETWTLVPREQRKALSKNTFFNVNGFKVSDDESDAYWMTYFYDSLISFDEKTEALRIQKKKQRDEMKIKVKIEKQTMKDRIKELEKEFRKLERENRKLQIRKLKGTDDDK